MTFFSYWHPSGNHAKDPELQEATSRLQKFAGKERARIRKIVENEMLGGAKAARSLSLFADKIILNHALPLSGLLADKEPEWVVCACENYGTAFLAPFDPLDLTVIFLKEFSSSLHDKFRKLLYLLWRCGFKLRFKVIPYKDFVSGNRPYVPENLRFLFGKKELLESFKKENKDFYQDHCQKIIEKRLKSLYTQNETTIYTPHTSPDHFVTYNILEFDSILRFLCENNLSGKLSPVSKNNETDNSFYPLRLLVENNILKTKEITLLRQIWRFLWTVRFHLHYLANKAQNNLTPFSQPLVAAKMAYPGTKNENYLDHFMRHYFLAIRYLKRIEQTITPYCFSTTYFSQSNTKRHLISAEAEENVFETRPIAMLRLMESANNTRTPLPAETISRLIRSAHRLETLVGMPEASRILLTLIRQSPLFLGKYFLNNVGILEAMIPPWKRFFGISRLSSDGYSYLLDKKCLDLVDALTLLENGIFQKKAPLASKLFTTVSEWKALYLSALLQKIGETAEVDSYVESALIARDMAKQLGLSTAEQETVYWLILHQDILHETIKKTENIKEQMRLLAIKIQSANRLKLIYLLTIADILSSSDENLAKWDESFLQRIYFRVCNRLRGHISYKPQQLRYIERQKQKITTLFSDETEQTILKQYLEIDSYDYWFKFPIETLKEHFLLFQEFFQSKGTLKYKVRIHRQETVISLIVPDILGNLAYLTKRLNEIQININYAEFYTIPSAKAGLFVLHSPWFGGIVSTTETSIQNLTILLKFAFDEDSKNFEKAIEDTALTEIENFPPLPLHERILSPARVYFDCKTFEKSILIEIDGRDGKGCLSHLCALFLKYKLIVQKANIRTYGARITNIFYLTDHHHRKMIDQKILANLQQDIINILSRELAP